MADVFPAPFADHHHRKKIDLDATLVPADKTDFDIVISITDTDLRDLAETDGFDIQFADDADVLLDFEIQEWIPGTGRLVAWVKVPSLSSSTDTEIRMYFGKPGATDVSNPAGVWTAWEAVYHLQESGSGSQGEYVNSVGSTHDAGGGYNGTSFGVNGTPAQDGGGLGAPPFCDHWQDFDDSLDAGTQNIGCLGVWPEHDAPWSMITSYVWMNSDNNGDDRIWGLSYGTGDEENTLLHNKRPTGGNRYHARVRSDTATTTGFLGDVTTGQWQLAIISIDFARASLELVQYTDGSNSGSFSMGGSNFFTTPDVDYRTMGNGGVTFNRGLDGGMAEVRLKETAADADDATTWWNNQSAPGTFHTVNALEDNVFLAWDPNPGMPDLRDLECEPEASTYGNL